MPVMRIDKGKKYQLPVKGGFFRKESECHGLLFKPTMKDVYGVFLSEEQLAELGYRRIPDEDER